MIILPVGRGALTPTFLHEHIISVGVRVPRPTQKETKC